MDLLLQIHDFITCLFCCLFVLSLSLLLPAVGYICAFISHLNAVKHLSSQIYPLKSQFCTHLSDSIRNDMYSFVKALFHCSSHGCRTFTAKSWMHKGISMKGFWGEREGSLHQHLIPMMQLFKWRSALCSTRVEPRSCCVFIGGQEYRSKNKHVWPYRPSNMHKHGYSQVPKHIGRIKIACSGFVLKVLNLMLLFVDCRPQKVKVMVLFSVHFQFQWGLQCL